MTTKDDFAQALGTLLSLDRVFIKDLRTLEVSTLAKMYTNYIQNAKDVNNKMEEIAGAMQISPKKRKTNKQKLEIVYGKWFFPRCIHIFVPLLHPNRHWGASELWECKI